MSFYDELLKSSSGRAFTTSVPCEVQSVRVDLDDDQFAAMIMDEIFEEFRTIFEWPEQNLKFSEPETPVHHTSKPSEVLTSITDGARGAKAIFICGTRQVEELITIRDIDGKRYELVLGPETMTFNLAEMPFCPPFSPGTLISTLGAKLIMGVLLSRF